MAVTAFQAEILRFLAKNCELFNGSDEQLVAAMEAGEVVFHEGRICGAWPQIVER